LVRFLWDSAPLLSLAHDVSDGGLELALAEAAAWSGTEADVDLPQAADAGAIVACALEHKDKLRGELRQIGIVR